MTDPAPHTAPARARVTGEHRWLVTALSGLSLILHAVALRLYAEGFPVQLGMAGVGVLVSAAVLLLNVRQGVPPNVPMYVGTGMIGSWALVNVVEAVSRQQPLSTLAFMEMLGLCLLLFTLFPLRTAVAWSAGVYGLFTAVLLLADPRGTESLTLTLMLGLNIGLAWYLARHGRSLSEEQVRSSQLREAVLRDALTQALSRRAMQEQLEHAYVQRSLWPSLVVLLDIDHFKAVNDRHGHPTGDLILKGLAQVVGEQVRTTDQVGRWGGEEFVVLLKNVAPEAAPRIVSKIVRGVEAWVPDHGPRVTVSAGAAFMSERGTLDEVVALADQRLYAAKAAGRNTFRLE